MDRTVAPAARATSGEPSVEPSSTTSTWSTSGRGVRRTTSPIFRASSRTGAMAITLSARYMARRSAARISLSRPGVRLPPGRVARQGRQILSGSQRPLVGPARPPGPSRTSRQDVVVGPIDDDAVMPPDDFIEQGRIFPCVFETNYYIARAGSLPIPLWMPGQGPPDPAMRACRPHRGHQVAGGKIRVREYPSGGVYDGGQIGCQLFQQGRPLGGREYPPEWPGCHLGCELRDRLVPVDRAAYILRIHHAGDREHRCQHTKPPYGREACGLSQLRRPQHDERTRDQRGREQTNRGVREPVGAGPRGQQARDKGWQPANTEGHPDELVVPKRRRKHRSGEAEADDEPHWDH